MRVRLDFPFLGALLIIAHLVGGTLTHNMGMNVGFKLVSGSFSVLVPVMMLLNLGSFGKKKFHYSIFMYQNFVTEKRSPMTAMRHHYLIITSKLCKFGC